MVPNSPSLISRLVLALICLVGLSNARTLMQEISTTNNPKFPALIAFGYSTLDNGNINFIHSLLRSNFQPHGINFPNHIPTDTILPFLDLTLTTQDLATGVCYASAGTGYDNITNKERGVIHVTKQFDMFKSYIAKLYGAVGEAEANKIVNIALYTEPD